MLLQSDTLFDQLWVYLPSAMSSPRMATDFHLRHQLGTSRPVTTRKLDFIRKIISYVTNKIVHLLPLHF